MFIYVPSHGIWINLNACKIIGPYESRIEFDETTIASDNPDFENIKKATLNYLKTKEVK